VASGLAQIDHAPFATFRAAFQTVTDFKLASLGFKIPDAER
jgi:hypothetical protein